MCKTFIFTDPILKIALFSAFIISYEVSAIDPNTISDHATFDNPHQLATGMHHVFVNGVHVLNEGEHTGAMPGRVVRGPGYKNN